MACQSKNLSALGYANGFTLWHYRTMDNVSDVLGENYFYAAGREVRKGDFIFTNAGDWHGSLVVTGVHYEHPIAVTVQAMLTARHSD